MVIAIRTEMVLKPRRAKPAEPDWKDSWCCSTVTPQHQRCDYRGRTWDWGCRGAADQLSSRSLSFCSRASNMSTYSVRPSTQHGRRTGTRAKYTHLSHLVSVKKIQFHTWTSLADWCTAINDASFLCEDTGELNSPLPGVMNHFLYH